MNDKAFFDTNILLYLYSQDELTKKSKTETLLKKHATIIVSTQVLNELANVMSKKMNIKFPKIIQVIDEITQNFEILNVCQNTIKKALSLIEKYNYSYYDRLIIAAALKSSCSILYSEDMHHGHKLDRTLKIVNPYTF